MGLNFTTGQETAKYYGTHEIILETNQSFGNPYLDLTLDFVFKRPDGSAISTKGFYDGKNLFKARAYCDMQGIWEWHATSNQTDLNGQHGYFRVIPSLLKGKLQKHPQDPQQFAYAKGDWFLHLGDTGYRYVVNTEPNWREYIEQAAISGVTKIRTWFAQGRHDVQALVQADRRYLNINYWQEIDRRLIYGLNHFPHLILQLIPFGEDREEVKRYGQGDPMSHFIVQYAQARFSALANVYWCIANDLPLNNRANITDQSGPDAPDEVQKADQQETTLLSDSIDQIGQDMVAQEPWGTLITTHQRRFSGYAYPEAPWSDIITLEDLGQVTGQLILQYRQYKHAPVVLDEDRYEHWRPPQHPRYFFRRLFWASLLSGGHPTYGGLQTFEPYDGAYCGLYGYYDACHDGRLINGAHDFQYIHQFFKDSGLTLVNMKPDDALVGDHPLSYKAIRGQDRDLFIVYLANPDVYLDHDPAGFQGNYTDEYANEATTIPEVTVSLPPGSFQVEWFDPGAGTWVFGHDVTGGPVYLKAPAEGDWVLLISKI